MTQGSAPGSADRLRPITGRPTLTTDPSTKARLEARMVAARTSCGFATAIVRSAALGLLDRAAAASQAMWIAALILAFPGRDARESSHPQSCNDSKVRQILFICHRPGESQ